MDDKFLYDNRPPLRTGFGENLYTRLSNGTPPKKMFITWGMILKSALVCGLVFAFVFAVSEPVRANVLNWVRQIAGLQVKEADSLSFSGEANSVPPSQSGSLATILKDVPFKFDLPAFVPGGFQFVDYLNVQPESVFMQWINQAGDQILFQVDTDHGQLYLTGTDAGREIQIGGKPALLFEGGYDNDHKWDPALKMTNVLQRKDNLIYWLIYVQHPEGALLDSAAIKDNLIQMMSSIP